MKNTVKWIIIAVLLVGILAGATALYDKYSSEFDNSNLVRKVAQDGISVLTTDTCTARPWRATWLQ